MSFLQRRASCVPGQFRVPWLAAYAVAAGSCFALTFAAVCPAHAAGLATLPSTGPARVPDETMTEPDPDPRQAPASTPAAETPETPKTPAALGNRAHSVEALSRRLEAWVSDPDPGANAKAVHRVAQGVPPGAMVAFLVAVTEHPRPAFESVVETATRYRKIGVRGHALAAWAAFGPRQAAEAIALAVDDREQGIRRLAVVLGEAHASPTSDALVARMLERDATLAAEANAPVNLIPDEPPAPQPESDAEELIVIDDEAPPVEHELIVVDDDEAEADDRDGRSRSSADGAGS